MQVQELVQSSLQEARDHIRKTSHLMQMQRSPSPIIRTAAQAMASALKDNVEETVFDDLEYDFRKAGHSQLADTIHELAQVLDDVVRIRNGQKPDFRSTPISYECK